MPHPEILIYSSATCPYCVRAKQYFERLGLGYREIRVDLDPVERERMQELSQRRTVPQIFIGGRHVGGFDDLIDLDREGGVQALLEQAP